MNSVDTYLSTFEGEILNRMKEVRALIFSILPEVDESVSYGMPAYKLNGKPLIYFAGYKNHFGLYATPNGHEAFKYEFAAFKQGKGSVQFPNNADLPIDLIEKVIRYRIAHVQESASQKN